MRSKHRRSGRHGRGSSANDQQKSVFDRLGRQIEAQQQLKRQGIPPSQYGDYGMPPPPPPPLPHQPGSMNVPDFPRYARDAQTEAELEWRYHERRQLVGAYPRERHPGQLPPPPPPSSEPGYDIALQLGPAYHPYHGQSGGPAPPPPSMPPAQLAPGQRESPKYDRHGNPIILSYRDRDSGPLRLPMMDRPPSSLITPGGMILPEVPPMRAGHRGWYGPDLYGADFAGPMMNPQYSMRMLPEETPYNLGGRRYLQAPPPPPGPTDPTFTSSSDAPRYAKWRERRDAITNLDRETAQSSSRTDSLKSTLQQPDPTRATTKCEQLIENKPATLQSTSPSSTPVKKEPVEEVEKNEHQEIKETKPSSTENHDISDGEIVDDEDSDSDDSELMSRPGHVLPPAPIPQHHERHHQVISPLDPIAYMRRPTVKESHYNRDFASDDEPASKKRRQMQREEYLLDYETISDDDKDLENIMAETDLVSGGHEASGNESAVLASTSDDLDISTVAKKSSEIELLDALGLDWANLVEIAKQSRGSSSNSSSSSGSAVARFSMPIYLRTLEISPELAGPKICEIINSVCRA